MYIKRLLIIVLFSCLACYATGTLFDHLYKKRWKILFFDKATELSESINNYNIIFLGNSRVHFGINPFYIDSVTKLSSYNFGNGGADAEDMMLTAAVYLQKHTTPRLTIISLDNGALDKNIILQTRYHYLFYLQNDTISKYMNLSGFPVRWIKLFPFLKYSFFDDYNRTSLFVKGKPYPVFAHNIYKGFFNPDQYTNVPAAGTYNTQNSKENVLWQPAINYLKETVVSLQRRGSTVVFVAPPEKSSSANRVIAFKKITDSIYHDIARHYNVRYLSFDNPDIFTDNYFIDDIHLNEPGTRIYSVQLANAIKSFYHY